MILNILISLKNGIIGGFVLYAGYLAWCLA